MKEKREAPMSPSLMIAIGFALLILLVTLLLMLPISSQSRTVTPPLTALFTATSAVCVTGQVLVDTGTHWSLFGQVVLIAAIQIGGLGVMTLLALVSMAMGRRIGLRQRTILQESVASFSVGGIVRLIRLALIGTAVIEGLGAAALAFRFVPMLGWAKGLWYSVFHAISAFCNAGFDLMGPVSGSFSSLECFVGDPLINLTVMTLILVAGLGFPVWQDLAQNRLCWKKLRLHTRAVLALTAFLVFVLAWINAFKIFKEVYFIAGAYPDYSVYTLQNYMNNMFGKLNYQLVTAAAYSFGLIVFALFGALFFLQRRAARGLN